MKNLIKKYKKYIISFSFVYIYILIVLISPSGYMAITPGGLTLANDYEIDNITFNNDINTIYVNSWKELTVFQKWLAELSNKITYTKLSNYKKSLSIEEERIQGEISKLSSHQNALITAYEYANKIDNNIKINYKFDHVKIYYTNTKDLSIGDKIVEINNTKINELKSYQEYLNIFYEKDSLEITLDNNLKYKIDLKKDPYLKLYLVYDIIDSNPKIKKITNKFNTGGPSGGLIQTISIYTSLLNIDLNKYKIAGTGTINNLGNIGEIGGLKQKFYTAINNKVDIFFVPKNQLVLNPSNKEEQEILNLSKNLKTYPVSNFNEVVEIINKELL